MSISRPTPRDQLKDFNILPISEWANTWNRNVQSHTSTRALQSLIPFTDGSDFTHPIVQEWYKMIMPKLQNEGWNFHDAFSRASVLWNNSIQALEYGFRLPYDFWFYKYNKGRRFPNEQSILRILRLSDNTMRGIAQALWLTLDEIWPKELEGKNQFQMRKWDPEAFIFYWVNGWKKEYVSQRWNWKDSRTAFHLAMNQFNKKNPSHQIETDMKSNIRVKAFYTYLKTIGEL